MSLITDVMYSLQLHCYTINNERQQGH